MSLACSAIAELEEGDKSDNMERLHVLFVVFNPLCIKCQSDLRLDANRQSSPPPDDDQPHGWPIASEARVHCPSHGRHSSLAPNVHGVGATANESSLHGIRNSG